MNLGNAYRQLGDYVKTNDFLERALTIEEEHMAKTTFKCQSPWGTWAQPVEVSGSAITLYNLALACGKL